MMANSVLFRSTIIAFKGLPRWGQWQRIHLPMQETQRHGFEPWVGTIPGEEMEIAPAAVAWWATTD